MPNGSISQRNTVSDYSLCYITTWMHVWICSRLLYYHTLEAGLKTAALIQTHCLCSHWPKPTS